MDRVAHRPVLRVAIAGLGPKGLFALERLLHHANRNDVEQTIVLDAFDPHPVLGAGPNFDPGEPDYLRMNFAADQLDMWAAGSRAVPAGHQRSFVNWRLDHEAADQDTYAPRAQVGRYLSHGLRLLLAHAPPNVQIKTHRAAVTALALAESGWNVLASEWRGPYDEVLITTGHGRSSPTGLALKWGHAATLIPAVYPVSQQLSPARVRPGAVVAARGFALSFIDASLSLTEGRGGSFEALAHPYRLRYRPGDADAGVVLPFSRTGRPMLPKPHPQLAATVPRLEEISQQGRALILKLSPGIDLHSDLLPIFARTAALGLRAATGRSLNGEGFRQTEVGLHATLARAAKGAAMSSLAPADEIERSLAVAVGHRLPDLAWALGHTWRATYPAIVERLSGEGLRAHAWPAFRRLATAMERVAFGPSPDNAAKLLALIEAGKVDLTHIAGGQIVTHRGLTSLRSVHDARSVDVVLDAVGSAPGASGSLDPLLNQLIHDGHARIALGQRGLDVERDGGCRGRGGGRTPGLSAAGRPTEDSVVGNDTLSRTLHPLLDLWAHRIVADPAQRTGRSDGDGLRDEAA